MNRQYLTWHEVENLYRINFHIEPVVKSQVILDLNKRQRKIKFAPDGKQFPNLAKFYLAYDKIGFFIQEKS